MPSSRVKLAIATLLKDEGYVAEFQVQAKEGKPELEIALKYYEGKPVIDRIERVSRSGLRVYRGKSELPKVLNGLGISIVSTSSGIMTDAQARTKGLGGEVIGIVA
jgi:small subunit ribosomal protein S8